MRKKEEKGKIGCLRKTKTKKNVKRKWNWFRQQRNQ